LTDREILKRADALAERGLTVLVIIDACFSGQLRLNAGSVFDRQYASGAGVVIMVSSTSSQTSAALGPYSAFARTVVEAMAGEAGGGRLAGTVWSGSERLSGYGKLSFRLRANNRATMHDARDTMEGTWHHSGSQVTLRFDDGRVVYRGTLNGDTLSGSASNGE